jgi:hypothetical protein
MKLNNNAMAYVMDTVRKIPESQSDDAWQYIADRLKRCGDEPSMGKVYEVCGDVVRQFGARSWNAQPRFYSNGVPKI